MSRGLRYLPAPRRGRRRLGLVGFGLLALLSLVWQQQSTLATFIDAEYARSTFTAATLSAIAPTATAGPASVAITWPEPARTWGTQQYRVNWSPTASGTGTNLYTGPFVSSVTHATGSGTQSDTTLAFSAVAAGSTHACGIARGTVYCWGTSAYYALGLGSAVTVRTAPTAVTGGALGTTAVTAVTAGTDFTCAIAGGKAYCWGRGDNGQLGVGGQTTQSTPQLISALTDVTSISAGAAHACAIAGGKAYCWGQGSSGQLGDSGATRKESPVAVKTDIGGLAGRTVASIAAGGSHTCAVADGQAFCWGLNTNGQLGDGTSNQVASPVAVVDTGVLMGRTVSGIAAGANHSCAVADGRAFCWGLGTSGQLGTGASTSSSQPVAAGSVTAVTMIASGANQTCVVAGGVSCWGQGIGNTPTTQTGSTASRTVTAVSVGTDYRCAAAAGAPAACAGDGTGYRLGNGSTATVTSFVDVSLKGPSCPADSVRVGAGCSLVQGASYSYRLGYTIGSWVAPDSDWQTVTTTTRPSVPVTANAGRTSVVLSWTPAQDAGQSYAEYVVERRKDSSAPARKIAVTGSTTWTDRGGLDPSGDFTQVSAGGNHTCGIVEERLYCWGQNDKGQLGIGSTTNALAPVFVLSGVSKVSAGTAHTCALTTAGTAYCWGDNASGQVGVTGTSTSPLKISGLTFSDISAGGSHTCAVATDGTAYCWGLNGDGQLGDNSTTTRRSPVAVSTAGDLGTTKVTTIAAGGAHTCAVGSNGRAYCWGQNASWQLGSRQCTIANLFCLLSSGQTDRPVPTAVETTGDMGSQSVTAITAGTGHTCALAAAKAYCWGLDSSGQLGDGSTTTTRLSQAVTNAMSGTVTAISAGTAHSCAIAAGTAYCWGSAANGRLGNGQTSGTVTAPVKVTANGALSGANVGAIAAGDTQGCLVALGAAYCWGSATSGRLGLGGIADSGNYPLAQLVVGDARCAGDSVSLGDGTCSLASGSSYQYRVSFTLDGSVSTPGTWKTVTLD